MIPDHLSDQAAAAIYAATAFGDKFAIDAWHDMADHTPVKITTRRFARAALEAVAADIWDEGYEAGMLDTYRLGRDMDLTITPAPNPYRASETA